MKTVLVKICTIVSLAALCCCVPTSKESYLEQFNGIYNEVTNCYEEFSSDDWLKIDKQVELYSGEYFEKFKEELTTQEKIKVKTYELKMEYYKSLSQLENIYDSLKNEHNIDEEIMQIEEKIDAVVNYIENDFVSDLEEMGEKTNSFLMNIWSDIENLINENE